MTLERMRDNLFSSEFNRRWADTASVQEPECVSLQDHGIGHSPLENIHVFNDLPDTPFGGFKIDRLEEANSLKDQDSDTLDPNYGQMFALGDDALDASDVVVESLKVKHLDRRSRVRHHHHHHDGHAKSQGKSKQQQKQHRSHHHHQEKRSLDSNEEAQAVHLEIRSNEPGQSVYTQPKGIGEDKEQVEAKANAAEGKQRVLAQSGSESTDPAKAVDSLGKASSGHSVNASKESEGSDGESHPKKATVMLAVVPILLLMGAIAGFTAYRRYQENSFNRRSHDSRDDIPGSPIHFDRTFLNTIHSPPQTATYLHDPENSSRHHSPSSIASANNMKRPPPSAGSHGKTRFQELSRSYDFGAGLRSIKNALSRSNNNSRDGALDKASSSSASASGSNNALGNDPHGKSVNYAFGAGGHSLAKIGSHPGLNALERQQLQQQYGANTSGGPSSSRFPDIHSVHGSQEHSIVWGQYSADDDGSYHDAAATLATNLARKSASSNSLSGGKYSHHHQQSSGHQPGTPTDSIGDCLSPESPSMSREELMRRREMFAPAYTFGSENSAATDVHSGTDLLFDGRDHFFDIGNEKSMDAAMHDEEMDMYLSMEKEESPYMVDDYNSMNPAPYEPKVLYRHVPDPKLIQKSAPLSEKDAAKAADAAAAAAVVRPSISIDRSAVQEEYDEKRGLAMSGGDALDKVMEETEETHVLGNASPEWNPAPVGAGQEKAVERLSANAAIAAVSVSLGSQGLKSGSAEFDLPEWEEDQRSTSTGSLATSTGGGGGGGNGNKGGKKKNKSKKGRKH
ncbi:hypothetical protein BGZ94_007112 [Podila epigama]|nr:hypothetical protein BGZ94_007112 [Podila epigama]